MHKCKSMEGQLSSLSLFCFTFSHFDKAPPFDRPHRSLGNLAELVAGVQAGGKPLVPAAPSFERQ